MFIHEEADVGSTQIGESTNIWQYCVVLEGARIGSNCNICSHCFIENHVVVGNNVTIKNGVQLWDKITIEDDVFVGPNATFTNDYIPRSKSTPDEFAATLVKKRASIGANATILPGITIGQCALVAAGAVVTRDVPDYALVVGSPAKFRCWICSCGEKLAVENDVFRCNCGESYICIDQQLRKV